MTRWRVQTPVGWFVPGMSGYDPDALWERYCRVMNKTRSCLEAMGYRLSSWSPK